MQQVLHLKPPRLLINNFLNNSRLFLSLVTATLNQQHSLNIGNLHTFTNLLMHLRNIMLQPLTTRLHLVELALAVQDALVLAHEDLPEILLVIVQLLIEISDHVLDVVWIQRLKVLCHIDFSLLHLSPSFFYFKFNSINMKTFKPEHLLQATEHLLHQK